MIQNWETIFTKELNQSNDVMNSKNNHKNNKIVTNVDVRNRCEIMEKNISIINKNNYFLDDCNKLEKSDSLELSECFKSITNLNMISNETNGCIETNDTIDDQVLETKRSDSLQTDSGIDSHTIKVFNHNLLYRKSKSYPNLKLLDKSDDKSIIGETTGNSCFSGQYIDDEIPDYSNYFVGRYVSYTGLLNNERPTTYDYIKFDDLLEDDLNLNLYQNTVQDLGIYPEKCQVLGAGAYYGQVSTKDGGKSYLAIGVQSVDSDDVIEASFTSIGNYKYRVQYQVRRPGYYVIIVKWGDYNIADSPFICKVTY
ncbi:uncharacterized protein LOC128962471 [Oppia nitens]|uniref:uncharacterized protein LOC128962471 n=1 Tax=Oppia nitens TaxID=1686743 RepID=UPI0023D9F559|nr:uncharacterized protein LOC128962471 [Oppia nitens]